MGKVTISNKPYTKDSKGFYIMPNELHIMLYEMGLTGQEKLIYEALVRYSNNSENNPFPSYSTLQKWASCGRATVSKGLKKLQELGLVEVLHKGTRQGDSNIYKINYVYGADTEPIKSKAKAKKQAIPFKRGVGSDGMTPAERDSLINSFAGHEQDYSSFDLI